jgi:hypothetical protein
MSGTTHSPYQTMENEINHVKVQGDKRNHEHVNICETEHILILKTCQITMSSTFIQLPSRISALFRPQLLAQKVLPPHDVPDWKASTICTNMCCVNDKIEKQANSIQTPFIKNTCNFSFTIHISTILKIFS